MRQLAKPAGKTQVWNGVVIKLLVGERQAGATKALARYPMPNNAGLATKNSAWNSHHSSQQDARAIEQSYIARQT